MLVSKWITNMFIHLEEEPKKNPIVNVVEQEEMQTPLTSETEQDE
ncbi:hypothetical protein GCM10020331_091430 [Ectobacillus funiculus]